MEEYNPHLLQHLSHWRSEELMAVAERHRLAHGMGVWLERAGRRLQGKTAGHGGALGTEIPVH